MTRGPAEAPFPRGRAVLLVLAGTAASTAILAVVLLALNNFGARNDFLTELWPAYQTLYGGHVHGFISDAPSYIGAAIWRAPLALAAMACGAGWRVTFLISAAPCFAAVAGFGVWFAGRVAPCVPLRADGTAAAPRRVAPCVPLRADGAAAAPRRVALGFAAFTVLDPVVCYAGVQGHPEELVGAGLAIAAVLVAAEGRHRLAAGLLLGALLNKPGLAEMIPVVLVVTRTPYTRRALAVCLAVAIVYAVYELYFYFDLPIHQLTAGITAGGGFFPWHLLWWLGAGAWPVMHEHVLVIPACVALAAAWWYRRAGIDHREALWLAAFMILFRDAFDPWNTLYYSLPLVLCLFCLEAGRLPLITVAASAAVVLAVPGSRILALAPDAQAALFTALAVPALVALAWRAYAPRIKPPAQRPLLPAVAFRRRNTYTARRQPIAVATHKRGSRHIRDRSGWGP